MWVYCDNVDINFPVPYFNNYALYGEFEFLKRLLTRYNNGETCPVPTLGRGTHCPYKDCGINFNLHSTLPVNTTIKCPQCLRDMKFEKGFLLDKSQDK